MPAALTAWSKARSILHYPGLKNLVFSTDTSGRLNRLPLIIWIYVQHLRETTFDLLELTCDEPWHYHNNKNFQLLLPFNDETV
jgi:hypothetical protein